ncbi:translocan of the chloroplast inner membrane protein (nucleomorph) [Bigelowiella natans]|uniref:Translocan of the chloroplast inner membrane protein n=1 Tax=Bigelowiella natans TaxID=227086 RepID=Q3LVU9_BIGNA|nr:translocan of the chloroplast inner membrane protein [Bigelowiella natans]ABA27416.1 translocan of the chloroplast inner membrane protein [Bigelowiella natans]
MILSIKNSYAFSLKHFSKVSIARRMCDKKNFLIDKKYKKVVVLNEISSLRNSKKKDKYINVKAALTYMLPLLTIFIHGRNTYSNFPLNLIIYELLKYPCAVVFGCTFLLVSLYMYLVVGIVSNRELPMFLRFHAAIANFLDLIILCLTNYKVILGSYIRWSFFFPLIDNLMYVFFMSVIVWGLWHSLRGSTPAVPISIQTIIDDFLK